MDQKLQGKCDLLADNYLIAAKSAKMDFRQAAALAALIYTQNDQVASEAAIRGSRALLKSKVSGFNNLRGNVNLALLTKMSLSDDPEAYLDRVMEVYSIIARGRIIRTEYEALAASAIADFAQPNQYEDIVARTRDMLDKMSKQHPLLTTSGDTTLASLLVMSGVDADATLSEAEECFTKLKKNGGFTMAKNALQAVSLVLALNEGPAEMKCTRFIQMREALKKAKSKIYADQLPIIAALSCVDFPVEQLVSEIHDVDLYLKGKKGFGGLLGLGAQMRRLMASALVLQIHTDAGDAGSASVSNSALTSVLVQQVVEAIIFMMIMIAVTTTAASSSH